MPVNQPYVFGCWYGYDQDCSSTPTYDYGSGTANMFVGSGSFYSSTAYGFCNDASIHVFGTFGSLLSTSFNSGSIAALYHQGSYVYFYFTINKPSFSELIIDGTNLGGSSSWSSISNTLWRKQVSSNPFGTSGGVVVLANY
tara:strand:+ start:1965 stop:2387 length:423 start_codon:yes stop_codon:yes gene_type:complete